MFAEHAYRELIQAYGRAVTADEMERVRRRLAVLTRNVRYRVRRVDVT